MSNRRSSWSNFFSPRQTDYRLRWLLPWAPAQLPQFSIKLMAALQLSKPRLDALFP
jgi:hypothetical protein